MKRQCQPKTKNPPCPLDSLRPRKLDTRPEWTEGHPPKLPINNELERAMGEFRAWGGK